MKKQNNLAISSIQFVFVDLIGDILHWPIWWYTKGLIKAGNFCINLVKSESQRLGILIWIKNIFVPMFGQYDREGRIISFFARLIQIIVRSIALFFWAVAALLVFLFWLLLPIYLCYQVIINFWFILT